MTAAIAQKVAANRAATLARLNSKKIEARQSANGLQEKATKLQNEAAENEADRKLMAGNPYDLFITPASLATEMAQRAHVGQGDRVLEPSAGTGRIAKAAKEAGAWVTCVDINQTLVRRLMDLGFEAMQSDFMTFSTQARYNAVLINPPFSRGQDIDHVLHAWDFIEEGYLVAIMSEGVFFRSDKKAVAFREWLEQVGGESEQLPAGTFKQSGTNVNARIVTISKQPNWPH